MILGFSIAAPVGPIGLLCLRRSLAEGRLAGFVSGLGAATADAVYGAIAALGLNALMTALEAQRFWLQLGGGGFLVYLGVATLLAARPAVEVGAQPVAAPNLRAAYFSGFALTLTNPMTILSFLAMFAGLGASGGAGWLVLGVFLGSTAWWWLLSFAAGRLGARLHGGGLRAVNLASGAILAGFGAWQVAALAMKN
jgi:threonine/homoserine/homoserine lactone efflux protein